MTKTIVITGASSGIGRALAEHFASINFQVVAIARRKEKLDELEALYPNHITSVVADITKAEDRVKIQNALRPNDSGIYLVHNAGIATPKKLSELTEEEWDEHYLVNTKAPIFLTKLLLPNLINGGRVLNVSTGLAHKSLAAMSAYGISKSALYMWKEYSNAEFNEQGILFASAMPGVVDTPIQRAMRSYDPSHFPAVHVFQGFFQRGELLKAETAAKFLSWLLLSVDDESFIKDDWDINNPLHQAKWAAPGEVKLRQSDQVKNKSWYASFTSFAKIPRSYLAAGAVATGIAAVTLINKFSH